MRCVDIGLIHKGRHKAPVCSGLPRATSALSAALLVLLVGIHATPAVAATCESLFGLALPETMITVAQSIPAGSYPAPDGQVYTGLPAFCRVAATLTPTSDSNIKIEVWMPSSDWNGRYLGTGNGGGGGSIVYGALAEYLALNYAVANTDQCVSDGSGPHPLVGHPEKQIDQATRSTYLMTVHSKQIIKPFTANLRNTRISSDAHPAVDKPCMRPCNSQATTTALSPVRPL